MSICQFSPNLPDFAIVAHEVTCASLGYGSRTRDLRSGQKNDLKNVNFAKYHQVDILWVRRKDLQTFLSQDHIATVLHNSSRAGHLT